MCKKRLLAIDITVFKKINNTKWMNDVLKRIIIERDAKVDTIVIFFTMFSWSESDSSKHLLRKNIGWCNVTNAPGIFRNMELFSCNFPYVFILYIYLNHKLTLFLVILR